MSEPDPNGDTAAAPEAKAQRRRSPRYLCEGAAEAMIVTPDAEILLRGTISNISLHGCFIQSRTPARLVLGSVAEVRFKVEGRNYRCAAQVRNIQPGVGTAFEFFLLSTVTAARIAALIKNLAKNASTAS